MKLQKIFSTWLKLSRNLFIVGVTFSALVATGDPDQSFLNFQGTLPSPADQQKFQDYFQHLIKALPYLGQRITLILAPQFESDKPRRNSAGSQIFLNRLHIDKILTGQWIEVDSFIFHQMGHLLDSRLKLSSRPDFLSATFWTTSSYFGVGGPDQKHESKNHSDEIVAQELKDPEEAFAVDFERYAMDSELYCRRPALYRYYDEYFPKLSQSIASLECKNDRKVRITSSKSGKVEERILDPSKISEIHYLLAAEGESVMSRWGHSMFRLVYCSTPTRCLEDPNDDIVVSVRARPDDLITDYFKGVVGDYNSRVFLLNFGDVIREYTRGELRDLKSYPLKFDDYQKKKFIERVYEDYWVYSGAYYFINQNCATESRDMLTSMDSRADTLDAITPTGLLEQLAGEGLIDRTVLKDRDLAKQKGYLFESRLGQLKRAFDRLKQVESELGRSATASEEVSSLEYYLKKTKAKNRRALFESWMDQRKKKGLPLSESLAANFQTLEYQILEQRKSAAQRDSLRIAYAALYNEEVTTKEDLDAKMQQAHQTMSEIMNPLNTKEGSEEERQKLLTKIKNLSQNVSSDMYPQLAELREVQRNIEFFIKQGQALSHP